jgi:predicted MPP superfamily phosphohydrolase
MIRNQSVRILWISDIHFSKFYTTQELRKTEFLNLRQFINQFISKIKGEHDTLSFDYIFLTGDLAQTGLKDDYDRFMEIILIPLFNALNELNKEIPKVISLPGNHDLMWKNDDFLRDYIGHIDTVANKFPDRPQYLKRQIQNFRKLFNDYTTFMVDQSSGTYRDYFELINDKSSFVVSPEYNKSRLFGHIIDKKRKIIIIILNTAWFSLGDGFNSLYKDYIKEVNDLGNLTDDNIKEWLETKDILTEYNKQITGIQLLQKEEILEYFNNYSDYMVITTMHHPRNWLEWTESYTHRKTSQQNDSWKKLKDVIRNSNVILTGHEHVPIEVETEVFENVLHLKAGCFLEFNQLTRVKDPDNFSNNWFSILNIDTAIKSIEQERFFFNPVNCNWENCESKNYNVEGKAKYKLTDKRKDAILKSFGSGTSDMLKNYLDEYFPHGDRISSISKISESKQKNYDLYKIGHLTGAEFCILVKMPELYFSFFKTETFFNQLIKQLKNHPEIKYIRFLVLDLFVDGKLKDNYEKNKCNRSEIFSGIVKLADNLFDVFRHEFFMRWEPNKDNKIKAKENFKSFADLKLVNQIIPYWVSERFWI